MVVTSFLLFWVIKKDDDSVILKVLSDKIDLHVQDFHYTETGDPDISWEINADTAQFIKKENTALFDKVRIILTTDGQEIMLKADKGRLHTDTKDIDLEGDVLVCSENGEKLRTGHLWYTHAKDRVDTDKDVVIETSQINLSGKGMTLFLKEKKMILYSRVGAVIASNVIF